MSHICSNFIYSEILAAKCVPGEGRVCVCFQTVAQGCCRGQDRRCAWSRLSLDFTSLQTRKEERLPSPRLPSWPVAGGNPQTPNCGQKGCLLPTFWSARCSLGGGCVLLFISQKRCIWRRLLDPDSTKSRHDVHPNVPRTIREKQTKKESLTNGAPLCPGPRAPQGCI